MPLTPTCTPEELISFQVALRAIANDGSTYFNSTRTRRTVLSHLGFKPSPDVLQLLASLRISRVCPLHLDVIRTLAADPGLRSRVRGITLDEFIIDLLGFARVRACLSRKFFTSWRLRADQEERLWWAAELLDRAYGLSLIEARRINSTRQLLRIGDEANERLIRVGCIPLTD